MFLISAIIVGLVTGALVGTLGIGAGALMVPLLVWFAGLTLQQSIGVTLAMQTLPVGIFGAYVYYRDGLIDFNVTAQVAVGMMLGILAGAWFATKHADLELLKKALGGVLVALGIFTLVSKS